MTKIGTILLAFFSRLFPVIREYWQAGGVLMLPLAAITFLIWWSYFTEWQRLKKALATPTLNFDSLSTDLQIQEEAEIEARLAAQPGSIPRLMRRLLRTMKNGLPFRDACRQGREIELSPFAHRFVLLAALVAAAPLLGLMGTVFGMIKTFNAVSMQGGQTSELVAGGISQALITTQVGLVAAVPGTFCLAHLRRLYRRLEQCIDHCESHLFFCLQQTDAGSEEHA